MPCRLPGTITRCIRVTASVIARDGPVAVPDLRGIRIAFEDDSLLVVDKPAGLLTVATESEKTDTAFARLSAHLAARNAGRQFVVHRLDRETSGLLLFARSPEVRDSLQANWDRVTKTYLAVIEKTPAKVMRAPSRTT